MGYASKLAHTRRKKWGPMISFTDYLTINTKERFETRDITGEVERVRVTEWAERRRNPRDEDRLAR
jgi:hypothetical protein